MITYLTIFNHGYIEFTKNIILNFKRLNIEDKFILYSLDKPSEDEIHYFIDENKL